jgi:hypothetical protein
MFAELHSIASALRSETLTELPDARLEEDFAELQRGIERLETERLRRLAEIDHRGLHGRDGHLSAVSWLASRHDVPRAVAASELRVARALGEMPEARRALEDGEVSLQVVRALAAAQRFDPEAFAQGERVLVEAARQHPIGDLQRVLGHWRDRVLDERLRTDSLREGRRLHASRTFGGMVRIDGDLDPETGESLLAALEAVIDAEARSDLEEDRRSPAQRRADALGEICRGWLDNAPRPTVAGERPHLTVTVDVGDLVRGRSGQVGSSTVGPEALRRLACDASVVRVVMAGPSEPLDVGRRTAVVPPAIRRALVVRDGSCRFPGCGRPHTWCDAHHVTHWADGGSTALSNLILLCRRHHRSIHEGFGVRMVGGQPVFVRPDGTPLADRSPPARAA